MSELRLQDVRLAYAFPGGVVLDGVNFVLRSGESCVLKGRSGCGKTSFLHVLGGLLEPSGGQVLWDGRVIFAAKQNVLRGRTIGFIFQNHCLLPGLTALENVLLPWRIAGCGSFRSAKSRAQKLLADVWLSGKEHSVPNSLSGGELQRVALARALLLRPPFLLADEPTGSLDGAAEIRVRDLLFDLCRREGAGLLAVSHGEIFDDFVDRTATLEGGKICGEGGHGSGLSGQCLAKKY
ncbi:MAG: ATP-binding cassette domain-containing protein [Puniceicoccales bacterium]|jgi:ABC-type lipoprotein export system ATPase subunit|nr:ATP-binding cassette domain-containing protein [Puniceicoccales bacterium]